LRLQLVDATLYLNIKYDNSFALSQGNTPNGSLEKKDTHPRALVLVGVPMAEPVAESNPHRVGQGFQRDYEMPHRRWGAGGGAGAKLISGSLMTISSNKTVLTYWPHA